LIIVAVSLIFATPLAAQVRKDTEARELMASADALRSTWSAGELRQALEKYKNAALIWTSLADHANASSATLKAGDVCLLLSDLREALKLYQQALLLAEKSGDRTVQGRALSQAGLVYSYMGDNELAKKHLTKALALLKVAENDPDATAKKAYGEALSNMAEIVFAEGYFPKALEQFQDARKFFVDYPEGQAKIHLFAAYITGSLGDADKALSEINESLNLYRAINNKDGEGLARSALGQYYTFKGNQDYAIELHRQAIEIFRSVGDRLGETVALNGLAQAGEKLNQLSLAVESYEDALQLFEELDALDFAADMTLKLAQVHQKLDHHEQAFAYYQRCLKLSRAGGKVRTEANALSEIAIVYASQGQRQQAAKQLRRAQEFFKTIGDIRGQATALNNYGDFLLSTSLKQEALTICREAQSLSERVGDKSILLTALFNLARAYKAVGDYDAGLGSIKQALSISEEIRANVGSPDARVSFFSGVKTYYDLYRDILMELERVHPGEGFAARAFLVSEESRARSLRDLIRESQRDLRRGATSDLLRREREVNASFQSLAQHEYDLSLSKTKNETELAEIAKWMDQLSAEYQEIQAKLRAQNPKQTPIASLDLKDLEQFQKELQAADAMLLEYSLGEERSYLWAITSSSVHSYELPSRRDLELATREFYESMTARQQFVGAGDYAARVEAAENVYPQKAARLSQMLLGPVTEQLGTKRLIVVTEGALQYVQFEALPTPNASYLIQTNEIVVLPSMSTLMIMRAERNRVASPGKIVAVFADPVFGPGDERVKSRELSPTVAHAASSSSDQPAHVLPRLAYASDEVDAIVAAAPWGSTMVAKGLDANCETAMSPRVGEYQIIHFATHGFLSSEHPELSAIVLSEVDQNGVEKNGLLSLPDIYSLDLSAELVVLSACQTALGKDIKGEGWVGLTHSFMSAGSKSVVASLWKVDDRATSILMSDFYHSMLQNGMTPVAALRAAKLKMIQDKQFSAPYYWAGFVFQGDYESRINVERKSRLSLGLALLLLVSISSGLIFFLRKRRR
jgi:CHAT domain-containing protein